MACSFGMHHRYLSVGELIFLADRNPFHRNDGSKQQQQSVCSWGKPSSWVLKYLIIL